MNAILLAAGRGSRLQEMTDGVPKCLVKLAGKSLLSWQLAALGEAGIRDFVVVRGYGKEKLFGDEYRVIDNPRWAQTNMVATLRYATKFLQQGAIVSYTDIVYHPAIVEELLRCDLDIAITYDYLWEGLWRDRFDDPLEDAETFLTVDGRVTSLGQRPDSIKEIQGQFMGLIKFTPAGWSTVDQFMQALPAEEIDRLDMTGLLERLIREGISVGAVATNGRWCEVDTKSDLRLYEARIGDQESLGKAWAHDWRW